MVLLIVWATKKVDADTIMEYTFTFTSKKDYDLQDIQKGLIALGSSVPDGITIFKTESVDKAQNLAMKTDYDTEMSIASLKAKYPTPPILYNYTVTFTGTALPTKVQTYLDSL